MFPCNRCGCCCRNLDMSELYRDLDRGDGVCKYLDGTLCSVYEDRPLFCRIDECYEQFFKDEMSIEEYYNANLMMCEQLREKEKKRCHYH